MIVATALGQAPIPILLAESWRPDPQQVDDKPERHLLVRWAEVVPVGLAWPVVVERIALVAEAAAAYAGVTIVVDGSVGRAVINLLRERTSLPLRAITAGSSKESKEKARAPYELTAPRKDRAAALEVLKETRRLHAVPDLGADLASDDLAGALALCAWYAGRPNAGEAWAEAWRARAARSANSTTT